MEISTAVPPRDGRGKSSRLVSSQRLSICRAARRDCGPTSASTRPGSAASCCRIARWSAKAIPFYQQALAKEGYESLVAQMTKLNEMYIATAKEAYKPFEASLAAFGVKAPK